MDLINGICHFIATVYTRLFQFLAVPTVALAIMTTLISFGKQQSTRRIFGRTITYTLLTTFFAALVGMGMFLLIAPQNISADILSQTAVWGNLVFLGLIASLVCFLVWNLVIDKLGNVTSTNYVYLNPIFTLLSAMALLGERMTLLAAVGSVFILLGVIWAGKH